jgi:acyl-homoserine-lactone acylase
MVQRRLTRDGGISLQSLMDMTLANENFAGQLIRDDLVKLCRDSKREQLRKACEVLANWDLHDNLDSRGTHLLRQMLASANGPTYTRYLPASFTPAVPFDPEDPLNTPRGLAPANNEAVLEHLARAVQSFENAGIALDARLGDLQSTTRDGERIPLHGGPEQTGVFNKIESAFQGKRGYPEVTRSSSSWIMASGFTEQGPRARGILTYSLSSNPRSPHFRDQTEMFSGKKWVELPYNRQAVQNAAERNYRLSAARPKQ